MTRATRLPRSGDILPDLEGRPWRLGAPLHQGGQGILFELEDPDLVAKIRFSSQASADALRHHLSVLSRRNLEIPGLVRPEAIFAPPFVGMVLPRVQEAHALERLLYPGAAGDGSAWYVRSGGLRRRLRLGARLAALFEQLEQAGLCYVDLSPDNVLVPVDPKRCELFLIDIDNLRTPGSALGDVIGTPWFIAPELLRGDRFPDHATDRWSLAVLYYYLLVLQHPFFGDEVRDGDPALEEKALRGELPWVDHPGDACNRTSLGLPREIVLTHRLRSLFHQAFEAGLQDRWQRPAAAAWRAALEEAADRTALCQGCGASVGLQLERQARFDCPFCGESSPRPIELGFFLPATIPSYLTEGERKAMEARRRVIPDARLVLDRGQRDVPARLTGSDAAPDHPVARFGARPTQEGRRLYALRNESGERWHYKDASGRALVCQPGEYAWLFDGATLFFPSGVRARVRNPSQGVQG